jgi:3-phosphoshikimate 1-carboxyvinyltransferase
MLSALTALKVNWELQGTTLMVDGKGLGGFHNPEEVIHCGNSATTMRLLAGALSAANLSVVLDGSNGLRRRPMKRIVEPLRKMGVPISASQKGTAPLTLKARPPGITLKAIDYTSPVASAQVKTALLLAALAGEGMSTIREPAPSRDHTERMLASMGSDLRVARPDVQPIINLYPSQSDALTPLSIHIPGDFSSVSFLMVAALVTPGSMCTFRRVGLNPTRTGLLDALREMGAEIQISNLGEQHGEPVGDVTVSYSRLASIKVDGALVVRMIDEFPIFAVAAAFAKGTTVVRQATELRYKETDRIAAVCSKLGSIGVDIQETPDGFIIRGGEIPRGGEVHAEGDHRLGMAMAVAGFPALWMRFLDWAPISR